MDSSPSTSVPVDITDHINAKILPIFAFIAIIITYLPFKSFYCNRNFPAANIVFVVTIQNTIIFMNAIIWPNGDWTTWWSGVGLCDIQGFIKIPVTTAIATSFAAFTRTLSNAIDVDHHNFADTPALRRRALVVDILICWTIPVLQIALYYVVQQSRFVIVPVYGCGVLLDNSWVTIVVMYIWAPLISIFSAWQACIIMWRLRKHRANLGKILSSSNSGYTTRRYIKLFMIAFFLIIVAVPVEFFLLTLNLPSHLVAYSWSRVHDPAVWPSIIYLSTSDIPGLQYQGWVSIALSFEVFAFFGFNDDAVDRYRSWLVKLGMARIWPSLREPREMRRLRRKGSASETWRSWRSHLNLVGKALSYLDRSKKNSQATPATNSECGQSRKTSHATASTIALATIASSHSTSEPGTSSAYHSFFNFDDGDIITPAPSRSDTTTSLMPVPKPTPVSEPTSRNNHILTSWWTHIHLPLPQFSSPKPNATTQRHERQVANPNHKIINEPEGIDAQQESQTRKSSLTNAGHSPNGATISTSIWSEQSHFTSYTFTDTKTTTQTQTDLFNPTITSRSFVEAVNQESGSQDPLGLKLGSRAYRDREREKREMERDKAERDLMRGAREGGLMKTNSVEILEEDVSVAATASPSSTFLTPHEK